MTPTSFLTSSPPTTPSVTCSSSSGFLAIPSAHHTHVHLRAFVSAVPAAHKVLPQSSKWLHLFILERFSLTARGKKPSTPHPAVLFLFFFPQAVLFLKKFSNLLYICFLDPSLEYAFIKLEILFYYTLFYPVTYHHSHHSA